MNKFHVNLILFDYGLLVNKRIRKQHTRICMLYPGLKLKAFYAGCRQGLEISINTIHGLILFVCMCMFVI